MLFTIVGYFLLKPGGFSKLHGAVCSYSIVPVILYKYELFY